MVIRMKVIVIAIMVIVVCWWTWLGLWISMYV